MFRDFFKGARAFFSGFFASFLGNMICLIALHLFLGILNLITDALDVEDARNGLLLVGIGLPFIAGLRAAIRMGGWYELVTFGQITYAAGTFITMLVLYFEDYIDMRFGGALVLALVCAVLVLLIYQLFISLWE